MVKDAPISDTHSKNQHSLSRKPVGNDNKQMLPDENQPNSPSLLADLVMGLRFYSRLPTGSARHERPELNRIVRALGFTSTVIGLVPILIFSLGAWLGLPPLLAACFGIVAQVVVTGAMAEDALADSADGLWGGADPVKRLEIMKDPRHGTYGVLAIVLLVAMRLAALSGLLVHSGLTAALLWLAAQIIARQGALWLPLVLPTARTDGTAHAAGQLSTGPFIIGGMISGAVVSIFAGAFVGFAGLIVTAAVLVLIIGAWKYLCYKQVGGYTGDLIGALQALLEIAALSTFILFI